MGYGVVIIEVELGEATVGWSGFREKERCRCVKTLGGVLNSTLMFATVNEL